MPTKKHLVIVESPAKARTIEKFLGADYSVRSSFGHIRDLPKKGLNVDLEHNFAPHYEISPDKTKVVRELRAAAKAASDVWLASDEDREGEAIAWHLTQALGLDVATTKRIVFHEITKSAIEQAIEKPRTVNMQLVDAQQARRILDRLVGYELSPVLWKKIRTGLSAGRVQSVAVRLIVEREREIRAFTAESSYKVTAIFDVGGQELKAELTSKFPDQAAAREFLEAAATSIFTVEDVAQKPGSRTPGAPFTTSTLQQEAARRLGYSVRQTMTLAQRLYEAGRITYMRTDSMSLSSLAIQTAQDYILKKYGEQYHTRRQFKTKSQGAQEAHEAIRPTDFARLEAGDDGQQQRLYQLIWQRALASQMSPAKTEKTEVTIGMHAERHPGLDPGSSQKNESSSNWIPDQVGNDTTLLAKGEVLRFDGFLKVYGGGKDDTLLPAVSIGDKLKLTRMNATETFSRPPARYSEAALVKKLEELGIGRPSTYAPTISTIQTRGYIEKKDLDGTEREIKELILQNSKITVQSLKVITGADRAKLLPTAIAGVTTDFLVKYFPSIVDYDFTAHVEADFDRIAAGDEQWTAMLQNFYKDFHPLIATSESASREEVSQARHLGDDPKTKQPIMARVGRYGPMLQRGATESEEKPNFAPLPKGVELEDVTLEQALEMFKLPRTVGKTEQGEPILANIGRFGPYIQVDKIYVSLKEDDPLTIAESKARMLYAEKLEQNAAKYIQQFASGVSVVNGQYGPYITDGKKNAKIPKDTDPATLTEAAAKKILAEAPAKKAFRRRRSAKR